MKNCEQYWAYADDLPLDIVVTYWCEKSGFKEDHCREGKKAAIVKACKAGELVYQRTDGKTFPDPVEELAGRNLLAINRESFDRWVTENFESETPLPPKELSAKERNTLLIIIAALCQKAGIDHQHRNATEQVLKLIDRIGGNITDDTIRTVLKKIPDALAVRAK